MKTHTHTFIKETLRENDSKTSEPSVSVGRSEGYRTRCGHANGITIYLHPPTRVFFESARAASYAAQAPVDGRHTRTISGGSEEGLRLLATGTWPGSGATQWLVARICSRGVQGRPRDRVGSSESERECAEVCSRAVQGEQRNCPGSSETEWPCAAIRSRGVQGGGG
eukprot:6296416-Amphidinium_carterae.1